MRRKAFEHVPMNENELRAILKELGISQREGARQIDIGERQMRRYCEGDRIPLVVEYAVRFLLVQHQDKQAEAQKVKHGEEEKSGAQIS